MLYYRLDLTGAADRAALHDRLAACFALPAYYGRNWDALWDCLDGRFTADTQVEVQGWFALSPALARDKKLLVKIFLDLQRAGAPVTLVLLP